MPRPTPQRAGIKLDGDKELIRKFRRLSEGLGQQGLAYAVMQGARLIEREAVARVPVRSGGGNLRDSITSEELKAESNRKRASVGVSWRVKEGISGIGKASQNDAFYGIMVEKGTKPRQRKSWRGVPLTTGPVSTGTMPSLPFLEPAFDAKRQAASEKVKVELWRLIRKVAKKVG